MKVCCLFNYNPFYRLPIYRAMDEAFDCDFYFGDSAFQPLRQFDARELQGFRAMLHAVPTGVMSYVWYRGLWQVLRRRYTHYILTGEIGMLCNWIILVWARLTGRKVLLWTHGVHETFPKWTTRLVYRTLFSHADVLLMYNDYNWRYMGQIGCRDSQKQVIHNSLDTQVQSRHYEQLCQEVADGRWQNPYHAHFGNDLPTVIYIGRLQRRKKVQQLLEAVSRLRHSERPVNLVLVGEMTDADDLTAEAQRLGLTGKELWMYGPSYDEDTNARLLYGADVCVCPSAVGLTAIHAMSYGCPVVSNDNMETQMPEAEAIIEGLTGSLFAEDDIDDLARHIRHWTSLTGSQRQQTREACRSNILQSWSVDYQMKVLKSVLV